MPTTRSLYTFEQFKKVLQQIAHVLAIEAVTSLETDELLVKGDTWSYLRKPVKGILSEVNTGVYHIKFYTKHLSFSFRPDGSYDHPDYIYFEIEEKFYSTSAHCTKISFHTPEWSDDQKRTDAERNRRQKKIDAFLKKLMKDADMKIEPRFSLEKYSKH